MTNWNGTDEGNRTIDVLTRRFGRVVYGIRRMVDGGMPVCYLANCSISDGSRRRQGRDLANRSKKGAMSSAGLPAVSRRRVRLAVRQYREAKGATQGDVAKAMDWSLSKVMRMESGEV